MPDVPTGTGQEGLKATDGACRWLRLRTGKAGSTLQSNVVTARCSPDHHGAALPPAFLVRDSQLSQAARHVGELRVVVEEREAGRADRAVAMLRHDDLGR